MLSLYKLTVFIGSTVTLLSPFFNNDVVSFGVDSLHHAYNMGCQLDKHNEKDQVCMWVCHVKVYLL